MIAFVDDRLAVMDWHRQAGGRYQVLPGGSLEPGETAPQVAVREAWEGTGLWIEVAAQSCLRLTAAGSTQSSFPATSVDGTFGTGHGVEVTGCRPDGGRYRPVLVTYGSWPR